MASEKNIAAFLRDDAVTVLVAFENNAEAKCYTYISHLPVKVGDIVAVVARDLLTIGYVTFVDNELKLEPGSEIKYKWIVGIIDKDAHFENEKKNAEIEQVVSEAYRSNIKRAFSQQVFAGLESNAQKRILAITGNATAPAKTKKNAPRS
jgi:hypothetical protein